MRKFFYVLHRVVVLHYKIMETLTDVEYIVYWFNELPLLCEERYREITEQAEAPLTYTPLIMSERLHYLITRKSLCKSVRSGIESRNRSGYKSL